MWWYVNSVFTTGFRCPQVAKKIQNKINYCRFMATLHFCPANILSISHSLQLELIWLMNSSMQRAKSMKGRLTWQYLCSSPTWGSKDANTSERAKTGSTADQKHWNRQELQAVKKYWQSGQWPEYTGRYRYLQCGANGGNEGYAGRNRARWLTRGKSVRATDGKDNLFKKVKG